MLPCLPGTSTLPLGLRERTPILAVASVSPRPRRWRLLPAVSGEYALGLGTDDGVGRQAMESVSVSLTAFIAAASLLTITPGLDTALVLRTAATGNARGAALAGLGIACGCFCWATLVAFGLGALL